MAVTPINSEDRLVQATFAEHLERVLGWESAYAWNQETVGSGGTLGRVDTKEAVLTRDLRAALERLNPDLPDSAIEDAMRALTVYDVSRSTVQHNRDFYRLLHGGVPVIYGDAHGRQRTARARVIDFDNAPDSNRFLAVRELELTGVRTPNYNRRADLVCFVNGLPLVFIELKAVYKNIREGFENNLSDYMDENVIAHAFHHNAFLIVSNGDRARYGSITSEWEHFAEWKRFDEADKGSLDAERLLNGMLAHDRLLDIVENFILFDESKPEATRKVIARNHQVLGVNRAVASVARQEELKLAFPPDKRLTHRVVELPIQSYAPPERSQVLQAAEASPYIPEGPVTIVERSHPDLGRLGVFWHTQGSGKSYSMAFFAEKVRRKLEGNFTFLLMTDRNDLDSQIYGTFVGCSVADDQTPRAASGDDLERLLGENHRYVFSLIHKFHKDVNPNEPYSERDDIIVISDEAHRTQAGRLARNMRNALPSAAFIGFTGTPLFKQDELTKRIFGDYVSRYDFKRSEEDGATVKLVYENRGEKLGVARLDMNERIAEKIEAAELDPDQEALLEKLLGKDYEVITADERLDKIAEDFVDHCATRWESGKSMMVCIDKITCARMLQLIQPRWSAKAAEVRAATGAKRAEAEMVDDEVVRAALVEEADRLTAQAAWLDETIVEIIISEAQNEVKDFKRWGFDIVPHRALMKQGFETADGKRVDVETAFKNPKHPFRVAIVCAMWMTGFDVECLSTLYIDKPMKAHTLMQAIARANRVYPGKDFGLIVDYNGMLKSLREALAQYALGDDEDDGDEEEEIVTPIEERVQALIEAIEATEVHLRRLGFDPTTLVGATGFDRIRGLKDAVEAVYSNDEAKRRFETLARQVFARFKALLTEPSAYAFAERHDNIEAIYKKLKERRDTADVTALLKELHRIVNEAIRTQEPGDDQAEGLRFDLSQIDMERLRDEFATKVRHKATALQDIRDIIEQKLAEMLARNPTRMDYQQKYEEIVAEYNREKDRATIEETFRRLTELMDELDAEQRRAVEEGLNEDELALFDLLKKEYLGKAERERVKQASRELLASITARLAELDRFWEKEQTKADVEVFILDEIHIRLPSPPFTTEEKKAVAGEVYAHVWRQAVSGEFAQAA